MYAIRARVFFFVVAPFCSCPASLVSRKLFAVGPGCAKCFFFVALRWARAKKNTPPRVFFLLRPRRKAGQGEAPCRHGAAAKNKHPGWCFFFFCSGPVPARGFSFPCLSPGPEQKNNSLGGVFFLLRPRADAHSLTAGLGGDASPRRGGVFFAAAPPGPGWCFFFFLPGCSLTHCGLGRFRQGPGGVFFFCCGPAGSF